MKEITHEEAKKSHKRLFESYLDGDWTPFPTRSDLDTYRDYITQQEKVNELLELYKIKDELKGDEVVAYDTLENGQIVINVKQELIKKIKELEELK